MRIYSAAPGLIPPLKADRSALGTLPFAACQYCEAVTLASAHGHYVFPPFDFFIKWTGADVLFSDDGDDWAVLQAYSPASHVAQWETLVPKGMTARLPSAVAAAFFPGVLQIWSGYFVTTEAGWGVLVRPVANLLSSTLYVPYEGLIEADVHRPSPLFINLRLIAKDVVIPFNQLRPLFQVQEMEIVHYRVPRALEVHPSSTLSLEEWKDVTETVRPGDPTKDDYRAGTYAVKMRKAETERTSAHCAGRN